MDKFQGILFTTCVRQAPKVRVSLNFGNFTARDQCDSVIPLPSVNAVQFVSLFFEAFRFLQPRNQSLWIFYGGRQGKERTSDEVDDVLPTLSCETILKIKCIKFGDISKKRWTTLTSRLSTDIVYFVEDDVS